LTARGVDRLLGLRLDSTNFRERYALSSGSGPRNAGQRRGERRTPSNTRRSYGNDRSGAPNTPETAAKDELVPAVVETVINPAGAALVESPAPTISAAGSAESTISGARLYAETELGPLGRGSFGEPRMLPVAFAGRRWKFHSAPAET
jgi:hypothetical protein